MGKFIDIKSHSLFQSDYIRLQSVRSSITISTNSSTKKNKKIEGKGERENEKRKENEKKRAEE